MSDKKHNGFIALAFLFGAACLYYIAASISMVVDEIIAMISETDVMTIFSNWFFHFKSGTIFIMIFVFLLSVILAVVTACFYRDDLLDMTLDLLYAFPLVIVAWTVIFNFAVSAESEIFQLGFTLASLTLILVYAGFTLKSMIKEIKYD